MPRSRGVLPEGAPSELWDFFEAKPGSTIDEAIAQLQLERSTAYYALARLSDLELIQRSNDERPRRWQIRGAPPVPVQAEAPGPELLVRSLGWLFQPTGMPYTIVDGRIRPQRGELQVISIAGAKGKQEGDDSRPGHRRKIIGEHPWRPAHLTKRAA
jgi:hypothetical protein